MKIKLLVLVGATVFSFAPARAQEFKVVTIVESIVPGGIGRSRIIDSKDTVDYKAFATDRTDGKESDQNDIGRALVKIENFEETKLMNFYSLAGINFQNIASNDAMISSKINALLKEVWQLMFVSSGVESNAGTMDGVGIFITRLYFKK